MNRKFLANLRIALRALRVNKMRSALTMLGIVIGVAAVIAMVAIGTGATKSIQEQIASIGSNLIIVMSGSLTSGGMRMGSGMAMTLTESDARAIGHECPAVKAASPSMRGGAQVVFGNSNWGTSISGVTPDYLGIRDIKIAEGNAFTDQDVAAAAKVCLLGKTVAENLFGTADPIGKSIRIKKVPFTVVGIMEPKGQSPSGQDQDDIIIMPISTAKKRILGVPPANADSVGAIMVQGIDSQSLTAAQEQIQTLLRQRHHLQATQEDDFSVRNLEEMLQAQAASAQVMSILLAAIASVSLIVGGIGIMNTMLISVTERTREIGLRQAVGAKTTDILSQFLIESVTLSIMGGSIGIALGVVSSVLITRLAQWTTQISPGAILVAFLFSALVGIFFGYYPARKAAMLDPIEALRYE